jgi:hypothetical protein
MPSPCISGSLCGKGPLTDVSGLMSVQGGDSAAGGNGAPGGRIFIRYVNQTPPTIQTLVPYLNYRGGSPGDITRVRTPSASDLIVAQTLPPNRCSMKQVGTYSPAMSGADGPPPEITAMDTNTALAAMTKLVGQLDRRVDYDYSDLANRANADYSIKSLGFSDAVTDFLSASLVRSETALVQYLDQEASGQLSPERPAFLLPILSSLDVRPLEDSALTGRELVLARELTNFRDLAVGEPISNYLANTGGLLDIADFEPYSRYSSQATRIDLATGNKILSDALSRLDSINATLFEHLTFIKGQRLQSNIDRVRASIADAINKAIKARATASGLKGFLDTVIGILTNADTAFGLVVTIADTTFGQIEGPKKCSTGNEEFCAVTLFRSALSQTDSALRKLNDLLASPEAQSADVRELREQLTTLESEYLEFTKRAAIERNRLFEQSYADFLQALYLRSSLNSKLAADSAQFHDLVRIVLLDFIMDPPHNNLTLRNNLLAIDTFLNGFPAEEPYFQVAPLSHSCESESLRGWVRGLLYRSKDDPCLEMRPSKKWRSVVGNVTLGKRDREVPFYIVSPQVGTRLLPIFGLRAIVKDIDTTPRLEQKITKPLVTREHPFVE